MIFNNKIIFIFILSYSLELVLATHDKSFNSKRTIDRFIRNLKEFDTDLRSNDSSSIHQQSGTSTILSDQNDNQSTIHQHINSSNITDNEQVSNRSNQSSHNNDGKASDAPPLWFRARPLDNDDYASDDYNSTLDNELNETFKPPLLFDLADNQYLIDGFQVENDSNRLFLIEELVKKLKDNLQITANVVLRRLNDTSDQRLLLITIDRLLIKYELIKQNIFLDKSAKYYDYLNCFYIQYNPNFGIRSYLRNDFTFDFKKAFINICSEEDSEVVRGHIYWTDEFKPFLRQYNVTASSLIIKYDSSNQLYELKLASQNEWQSSKDAQIINNLKNVYQIYDVPMNESKIDLNGSCSDGDYLSTFEKVLNFDSNPNDKIQYLNELNSSHFHDGLHQKLNKFNYLKAHMILDSGLLKNVEKENLKMIDHLFQIIYESQNHFKQLNMYLVVVRLRFKMPNDLNIFSNTDLRMDIDELYKKIKVSNDDTYFDLPANFKILLVSFKFYHQTGTHLIPSYSSENLISAPNSAVIFDFSYLKTNHWLLTYEIGHLLGIKDDNTELCKCLSGKCVMKRSTESNQLTWSDCSIKQFESNFKSFEFDLELPVERTEFKPDYFNYSICGNGVLERDELCDCGKFGCYYFNQQNQSYESNQCCNATTCRAVDLKSKCASGSCCDLATCQLHRPGRVCRSSENICDIEESCDGVDAFCPEDDHYVDGEFCGINSICVNKRCVGKTNGFSCENLLGEDAFESVTCLEKNMVASELHNCGYSIVDHRWISCRSIQQARCGSFQCALSRNSLGSINKFDKSFELMQTGTSINRTHECVLVIIKQNLQNSTRALPFYAPDGTTCSSDDDSLSEIKFCSNGECKSNREFNDYLNCHRKANCTDKQRCTRLKRCRCEAKATVDRFNFTSAFYCPVKRSLSGNIYGESERGMFDRVNFYHLLIIPCFAVVLVMAGFLRSYLRTGVYKVNSDTTSDELSVSFSGPRPIPYWAKPKM